MTQKRASSQQSRQALPASRERRELRLPLSWASKACFSPLARERDPVGREHISSRRQGGAPPNLQTEKSGPPPSIWKEIDRSSTLYSKTRRVLPQLFRGSRRELLSSRELLCLLVNRLSVMKKLKRPHS